MSDRQLDDLLSAAEALFAEKSYHNTTVADIATRAGLATGSVYRYFESKRDLLVAVVRAINEDVRHAMRYAIEETDGSQGEVERAGFDAFFDLMSKRPGVYRVVREAEFVAPEVFREYYERLARGYVRGVQKAQVRGEVDIEVDPEVVAFLYMGAGYFLGMRWAEWTGGGLVPEDVRSDFYKLLRRALEPGSR
ncbi:MAG TPA: TetR/AcrR family transcriptional regulator [Acidimicrobiia bacterium]|nr:TetR/AcrR family transcriptional regulator [Acidimicrobiia bacterium]